MLIDRHHIPWGAATAVVTGIATAFYVPYHLHSLNGTAGGTIPGLIFGILGFALLFFIGLLGFRRYVPAWRIGRMEIWLRAHFWLGITGSILIVYHSGFHFGGPLTTALMWLLIILNISGFFGIVVQQIVPKLMTLQVPLETIYDQIDHVRSQLLAEADERVEAICGPLNESVPAGAPAIVHQGARTGSAIPDAGLHKNAVKPTAGGSSPLRDFYVKQLQPFLAGPTRLHPMSKSARSTILFANVRTLVPPALHETLADLEQITEECRQLLHQKTLHHWLHGWLLVHVPLSYAFLVLAIVHAVYAIGY